MINLYCYIFGALPVNDFSFNITDNDLVIAADSGLNNIRKLNIIPQLIIGDFDSLGYKPEGDCVITHPVEKDDTDTLLAVKYAFEKGYKHFRIFGCIGGRLDHTFANIQTATYIAENGGTAVFYGESENFTVIKNNHIRFEKNNSGNISVFALKDSKNIDIEGLFFEMKNGDLSPSFPLGVSNKFINTEAIISTKNGTLLIIWENKNKLTGE